MNKEKTIWNKAFTSLLCMNFFTSMAQFMLTAVTPKYAATLGVSATMIGTLASVQSVSAIVVKPFVGPTVNAMDKKKLLFLIRVLGTIAGLGHAFSTNTATLMVSRLLFGVAMGFSLALNMTMVSDTLPESKLASGLGVFSLGQALATALGPYLGLEIIDLVGYKNTFFVAAGLNFVSMLLVAFVSTEPIEEKKKFKIDLKSMVALECWMPALVICLFAMSYGTFSAYLALYGDAKGIGNVGLFFTVYALAMLVSRPLSGKLTDKYGAVIIAIPCCILFALAFILIGFAQNLLWLLAAALISAFAYGGVTPAMQALCIMLVPKERRAAASSTNYLGMDLGHFLGPVAAGVIIDAIGGVKGYQTMFFACVIPIAAALAIILLTLKLRKKASAAAI